MSHSPELAWCAREVVRFPRHQALASDAIIRFFELTGLWRYPAKASGDLEEMGFLDKVYWAYKAGRPVRRAARGSALEELFARQPPWAWTAPGGFETATELRLSAAGDLMDHAYLARSADTLYRDVADVVFGADVAMANLECVALDASDGPLEIDMTSGPKLYLEPHAFHAVTGGEVGRYAFLATACNHSLDYGEEGVASTIRSLRSRNIAFHGVNERE